MEILNESNRLLKKIIKSVFAPLFVESEYENEEEISEKDILDDKQLDEKMKKILAEGLKEATKYDYIIQQDNSSNKTLNDTKINRQTLEEKEVVKKGRAKEDNDVKARGKQPKPIDKARERDWYKYKSYFVCVHIFEHKVR